MKKPTQQEVDNLAIQVIDNSRKLMNLERVKATLPELTQEQVADIALAVIEDYHNCHLAMNEAMNIVYHQQEVIRGLEETLGLVEEDMRINENHAREFNLLQGLIEQLETYEPQTQEEEIEHYYLWHVGDEIANGRELDQKSLEVYMARIQALITGTMPEKKYPLRFK